MAKKKGPGQPRKYEDPKTMEKAIELYFETITDDEGKYKEPPTVTGLAIALGFESRQSMYDYEKNGEYSYIIKRAKLRIEQFVETRMYGNSPTGAIFVLKNMGWSDKTEQEISGPGGGPIKTETTHDLSKLSTEELRKLDEILSKA